MWRGSTALIVLLACGALHASHAAGLLKTVEECIETGTMDVSLPRQAPSQMSVTPCRQCKTLQLQIDEGTRFYIGKDSVSFDLRPALGLPSLPGSRAQPQPLNNSAEE